VTDERKTRVAKNEALFRSLNEQVKEVAEPLHAEASRVATVHDPRR
jgi:hypothetical protein